MKLPILCKFRLTQKLGVWLCMRRITKRFRERWWCYWQNWMWVQTFNAYRQDIVDVIFQPCAITEWLTAKAKS